MKKIILSVLTVGFLCVAIPSCSENKAAEVKMETAKKNVDVRTAASVKKDSPAIGKIETDAFELKLHRVFAYEPKGSEVLAGTKPKPGHKFIYLDVSLRNKAQQKLEGGFLFIALRLTDEKGAEFKKPAVALAVYASEHPEDNNADEYAALWESFEPNEFHREIVYAVEVPTNEKNFVLHMPTDRQRKEWKTISFSL